MAADDLTVVESQFPNPDQLKTILGYKILPSRSSSPSAPSVFLSAHPSSPSEVPSIRQISEQPPSALKWPVVVDWHNGYASVGNVEGVKEILERLRQERDGE